jgi:hypothetical protein
LNSSHNLVIALFLEGWLAHFASKFSPNTNNRY